MIRRFTRPMLRFPVKWANAVSDWLLGLSSDGSIVIQNAASPTSGVPRISVSAAWLSQQVRGANRETPAPLALAKTTEASQAAPADSPTRSADRWSFGTGEAVDADGGTSSAGDSKAVGCTFDVVSRARLLDGVQYLYFRTVTLSPLGVVSSVSAENKCVGVIDQSSM